MEKISDTGLHLNWVRVGTATFLFTLAIALVGALMMTLTSSPQMQGAAFLWLPAALQLIAGVWFGPWLGFLAGGIGAYTAGIIAYGGWGTSDIIINLIAGGFANAMLPSFLFRVYQIDPNFGTQHLESKKAISNIAYLLFGVMTVSILLKLLKLSFWAYLPPIVLLFMAPNFFKNLHVNKKMDFLRAFIICIFVSLVSAIIGVWGTVVSGKTVEAAVIGTGIGWFLGDTGSCLLGLYILAFFTNEARTKGISTV